METTDPAATAPTIAIVGSGPSGCYTAQFLRKHWRDAEIVIFDRLASPYGLLRYGVAPDHVGTRAVAKQFDRLFTREGVRFCGSTLISSTADSGHLSVDQLRDAFDIVVLATGLYDDRALGGNPGPLGGVELSGLYGAGRLTRLINGHPDESVDDVRLGERVVIVGHGNVAIDLVRLMMTPPAQLRSFGVADDVIDAICAAHVREVNVVGRSQPDQAKFDVAMIKELHDLPDVRFESDHVDGEPDGTSQRHDAILALVAGSDPAARRTVRFHFGWEPVELTGLGKVSGITVRSVDATSRTITIPADSVCTAIGFTEGDRSPLKRAHHEAADHIDLNRGVLGDGLFCVGWLRRGPKGTIPANRVDARLVVDSIVAHYDGRGVRARKPGYRSMKYELQSTTTTN